MTKEQLKAMLLDVRKDYFHVVLMLTALDPKHAEYNKHKQEDRTNYVLSILERIGNIQNKFIQTLVVTSQVDVKEAENLVKEVLEMPLPEVLKSGIKKPIAEA